MRASAAPPEASLDGSEQVDSLRSLQRGRAASRLEPARPPWHQRTGALALALLGLMLCFFLALDLMGIGFKLLGKGFAEMLVERTANPFVGLLVGILATTMVQSSSTTTSMTVGIVAAGGLTIEGAIPIIMGANIGTSVTSTIVSLGHIGRPEEFRRAFAGATLHDFFNWLAVLILFPLELAFGFLSKSAMALELVVEDVGGTKLLDPLKLLIRPLAEVVVSLVGGSAVLALLVALLLLFGALRYLVVVLRKLLSRRAEQVLHNTLFRSAGHALVAGLAITVMVQSSSISTSVIVPLVGAGVVTLERLFPFTIGANIGTTVTAMLAALSTGSPAAIGVALGHLLFNVFGALVIYPLRPLRAIPLGLARRLGDLAVRSRVAAGAYVLGMFYLIPLLLLLASGALRGD